MKTVSALALVLALSGVPAAFAQEIGVTAAVNQSATGTVASGAPRTLLLGDNIIHNEKIVTDGKGLLQILLADGSSFTVGPNSSIVIDSFVYDPNAGTAKVAATLGTGLFRFIGGQTSKTEGGATFTTPVGTVGIQGGIANLDFSGAGANHIDLLYGVQVTLTDGTQVIGNIYQSGYSIVIDPDGKTHVVKTPPEWNSAFQQAMSGNGRSGGQVGAGQVAGAGGQTGNPPPDPNNPGSPSGPSVGDQQLVATWNDMQNNPDLNIADWSGALLLYTGSVSGTLVDGSSTQTVTDGDFQMNWNIADRSGAACFITCYSEGYSIYLPLVGDNSAPGTAPATFGLDPNFEFDFDGDYDQVVTGTINGVFLNTAQGNGTGVAGTITLDVTGTDLEDDVAPFSFDGVFSGNFDHILTPG